MGGRNLLVVDWDFFFPTPVLAADPGSAEDAEHMGLYVWDHAETPLHTSGVLWSHRAQGFIMNGLPLPTVRGWEGFWSRFTWADGDWAPVVYGDSNVHAGRLAPSTFGWGEEAWATVSLWDAHHDSGYKRTKSYEEWLAQGQMTCEDWMLQHYSKGSRLEVTYPSWRQAVGRVEPEPLVPVERRVDDGTEPGMAFDAVYVCRSGAWVPPWCDEDFETFVSSGPDPFATEMPGNEWEQPRPDCLSEAREMTEAFKRMNEEIAARGAGGGG